MQERVSLVGKYSIYLHSLAEDYGITFSDVVNELCEWAISEEDGQGEFEDWMIEQYGEEEEASAEETEEQPVSEELEEEEA